MFTTLNFRDITTKFSILAMYVIVNIKHYHTNLLNILQYRFIDRSCIFFEDMLPHISGHYINWRYSRSHLSVSLGRHVGITDGRKL